jgi:hypothetical protein
MKTQGEDFTSDKRLFKDKNLYYSSDNVHLISFYIYCQTCENYKRFAYISGFTLTAHVQF